LNRGVFDSEQILTASIVSFALEFFQCTGPLIGLLLSFRFRDAISLLNPTDQLILLAANHLPVIIGEFGCCTYKGAEDAGGWGWTIVEFNKATSQL